MKKTNIFNSNPFDKNLDFTQEFIDDPLDLNKKSSAHTDRLYPTANQNQTTKNEKTQENL